MLPHTADAALDALREAWRSLAMLDSDLVAMGVWLGAAPVRWHAGRAPPQPDWLVAYG